MPTNKTVITVIIVTLAAMAFCCVVSICVLAYLAIEIPPELNTLAGGLVGALSAMLTKTSPSETTKAPPEPLSPGEPAKVEVVNTAQDPVQTEETKK